MPTLKTLVFVSGVSYAYRCDCLLVISIDITDVKLIGIDSHDWSYGCVSRSLNFFLGGTRQTIFVVEIR